MCYCYFSGTPVLFVTPWTVVKILYENTEWVFEYMLYYNILKFIKIIPTNIIWLTFKEIFPNFIPKMLVNCEQRVLVDHKGPDYFISAGK